MHNAQSAVTSARYAANVSREMEGRGDREKCEKYRGSLEYILSSTISVLVAAFRCYQSSGERQ